MNISQKTFDLLVRKYEKNNHHTLDTMNFGGNMVVGGQVIQVPYDVSRRAYVIDRVKKELVKLNAVMYADSLKSLY